MGQKAGHSTEIGKPLTDEEIWAKICLTGNLAGLSDEKRWLYYQRYCEYLDLDPITRPFDLITTYETGPNSERIEKTVLYANASCAAQLANNRHITYGIPIDVYDPELGTVTIKVMAQFAVSDVPRSCWRRGVAHVSGLKGRALENAIKRAETQAHRRATLALCGVSMPDESEIPDIEGAEASAIIPTYAEAVAEDISEMIGTYLKAAGQEDNSAARAFVIAGLETGAFQAVAQNLRVPIDVVLNMNKRRKGKLEDIRLDEAAARVESSIGEDFQEKMQEAREKLEDARQEEKAIKEEAREARKEETAAVSGDAVAGLVVTLSETQQKVSDAVMLIIREYKRDRRDVLGWVSKFMKREISKAVDLDDVEAVRVLKWLNAWKIKLEKSAKASPPMEFCQIYRNHDDASAARLDDVYARLTLLKITVPQLTDKMQEVLVRIGAPVTNTRYAIDDEAAVSVCEVFEEWADDLEKEKSA